MKDKEMLLGSVEKELKELEILEAGDRREESKQTLFGGINTVLCC